MGVIDGGIVGVGYTCGCEQRLDTTEKKFCENHSYGAYSCWCYNIGGNLIRCTRHIVLPFVWVVLVALGALIAYNVVF